MSNYNNYTLKLDLEFTNLIQPLEDCEYKTLERKIGFHTYRNPIYTWNGLIVDGVEAYQICHKRGIKFRIKRMYFLSREDAISWICTQQLKREDLTEANRKYVIGKKYDAVKTITVRLSSENSNARKGSHTYHFEKEISYRHISATQIASECNTSSVPTTNIKPCIRSLYIYTSFLKHTACNNSCGNIDNPPQIPPATICILLLGIYFMPISKNGITNTIIIKTHPKFAISEYFFISFGSLNGIALG